MASSALISSAYFELLLSFMCFIEIPVREPLLIDMVSPVSPLIVGCATYEYSTQNLINVRLSALRISSMLIFLRTYHKTCFNFPQLSSSGIRTIVVKKNWGLYILPHPWACKYKLGNSVMECYVSFLIKLILVAFLSDGIKVLHGW